MNYNTLMNKPTINNKELIGNNKASDIGGLSEEEMEQLLTTDLTPYYTKAQIDDLFSRSYVYREKSGSIVTFDCPSTSQTIPKVTAEIVAVQSGTGDPSPTNVRPISGWNAVDVSDSISINEEIESGSLSSEGLNIINSTRIRTKNYISAKPNTTYLVDWDSDSITYFGLKGYTVNDFTTPSIQGSDWIAKGSIITTDANVNYIRTNFRNNSSTDVYPSEMSKLRVTPISNYYTIDLGVTRYGCTIDVVSGVLTVDRASVDLGTLYWSYSTADERFFTTSIKDIKKVMDAEIVMNGLCSHYDIVAYQYVHKSTALDGVMGLFSTSTTNYLAIKDTRYTNATAFTTAMNGVQLVYELATPQTYQLTPTAVKSLEGTNNLWADSGDITVKALDKIIQE